MTRFSDAAAWETIPQRAQIEGMRAMAADDIASLYEDGLVGCIQPTDDGRAGIVARFWDDEFSESAGRNRCTLDLVYGDVVRSLLRDDGMHVPSNEVFNQWQADGEGAELPCTIKQDSGNCVDASNAELKDTLLGIRAASQRYNERFRWRSAYYAYAERGYCGAGWYTAKCAEVNLRVGWCPMTVIGNYDLSTEDKSERLAVSTWCRSGIPDDLLRITQDQYAFEPGSIVKFTGGIDALRAVFQAGGCIHHGSNTTSGSSTPGRMRSIGGHAQTAFGAAWDDATLKHFRDAGLSEFTADNFPVVNHQTWGGGWSGECADRYWPQHWGPKPQGAWICSAKQFFQHFTSSAYAYFPKLRGVKRDTPLPPPEPGPDPISGSVWPEPNQFGGTSWRGELLINGSDPHILVPSEGSKYAFRRKPSV